MAGKPLVIITDPVELERRAIASERDNMAFRAWTSGLAGDLKARLNQELARATDEVTSLVSCVDCGRCCRELGLVAITATEAARISGRLGMGPAEFRRHHTVRDGEGIWLKGGPCPLLDGKTCTAYQERPQACRDFPYLDKPGFTQRTLFLISNTSLCPIVFHTLELLRARLPWRRRQGSHR